jgi:hypothetical protein
VDTIADLLLKTKALRNVQSMKKVDLLNSIPTLLASLPTALPGIPIPMVPETKEATAKAKTNVKEKMKAKVKVKITNREESSTKVMATPESARDTKGKTLRKTTDLAKRDMEMIEVDKIITRGITIVGKPGTRVVVVHPDLHFQAKTKMTTSNR